MLYNTLIFTNNNVSYWAEQEDSGMIQYFVTIN